MDAIAKKDFVTKKMKAETVVEPLSVESVQSAIHVTRRVWDKNGGTPDPREPFHWICSKRSDN